MADISILSRLVNGLQRNIDVSQNSLIVGSLKIGSSSPVEITKAIATKLLAIHNAADADGTYDTRYNTKTALASTANGQGASLVGIEDAGAYYTGNTVEAALQELGAAVGTGDAAGISFDPTGTSFTADDLQELGEEIDTRLLATEAVANAAIPASEKGANNGVATLDGGGKIPVSQLPNAVMTYEGVWDASTNTPTLADGVGNAGMVYRVTGSGSVDFGSGPISFSSGDYVIYSGSVWQKSDGTDAVTSVNGFVGVVVLSTDDIDEGVANKYFTDERAQDAVGSILSDTATIDFTYDDAGGAISAIVKTNSIGNTHLTTGVADQKTITGGNGSALAVQESPKIVQSKVVGESLADDETFAVRMALTGETAGRVYKADKDASTSNKFFAIGLTRKVGGASAGDSVEVTIIGSFDLGANDTPFASGDVGKPVYLGAAGALTLTPPSTVDEAVFKIGMVETTTKILLAGTQLHGIN